MHGGANECMHAVDLIPPPMPKLEALEDITSTAKLLSDPSRAEVFSLVCRGEEPQSLSEVSACCEIDQSVVSRHLKTLADAKFLKASRDGRRVLYKPKVKKIIKELRAFADLLEETCVKNKGKGCC